MTRPQPSRFIQLKKILDRFNPNIVQGWLYYGNLVALLGAAMTKTKPALMWNIRHYPVFRHERIRTRIVIGVGALFSRVPKSIIYNSQESLSLHNKWGYPESGAKLIPNGFDVERFRPDEASGADVRKALDIPPDATVIGTVARYHPMKGHGKFLEAAIDLSARNKDVHYLMAGKDVSWDNDELAPLAAQLPAGHVHLVGERNDVPALLNALTVLSVASAWGEAFPNVLGEAMACGVPCVATELGDCAHIVGDTGLIVPPGDVAALAEAWHKMIEMASVDGDSRRQAARRRVVEHFDIAKVGPQYLDLYRCAVAGERSAP